MLHFLISSYLNLHQIYVSIDAISNLYYINIYKYIFNTTLYKEMHSKQATQLTMKIN
jgi:hypothetical protein